MILNEMMIASKHHITIHNPYQAHYCEIGLFCLAIIFGGVSVSEGHFRLWLPTSTCLSSWIWLVGGGWRWGAQQWEEVNFFWFLVVWRCWAVDFPSPNPPTWSWSWSLEKLTWKIISKNKNLQILVHLGGGFKYCLFFTPTPMEMIQFDDHIFQMGWNHHLDMFFLNSLILGAVSLVLGGRYPHQQRSWFVISRPCTLARWKWTDLKMMKFMMRCSWGNCSFTIFEPLKLKLMMVQSWDLCMFLQR